MIETLSRYGPPERIMQRKKEAEDWQWIPAEAPSRGRRRAIGGLSLAVACLCIGILIGRVSISTQPVQTADTASPEQVPTTTPDAAPEPGGLPEPERSTAETAPPTLALGSEPQDKEEEHAAVLSPAPTDPPLLRDPQAAASPGAVEKDGRGMRWRRALSKKRWISRRSRSVGKQAIGSSRDYQALRDYVLGK